MHTFTSELAGAENQAHSVGAAADDVWLVPMPLSHAMGLRKLHAALLTGSTTIITSGVAMAGTLFSLLDRYHVTILVLVPAYLSILLRLWHEPLAAYSNKLRCIRLGSGAPVAADLQTLSTVLPDVRVCSCYGSTEASDCATLSYIGKPPVPGCAGKVNPHVIIRILGDDGAWITAPGQTGRIMLEGPHLMCGYFGDPAETARILQDGRLLTGDVGYFDANGLLHLLSRADEVIASGGYKIAPSEIETAAMQVDGVADCA